ncbi:MAG: c-type cytochrome biogenesis protein CcmI [Kiloniellales bacterium]|nr:c-type cytochrome biogenesis protein CcmI [Kiloniellales bacterium]
MSFWILGGVLLAVCIYLLLRPLGRKRGQVAARQEFDITVYKDQLNEVQRDKERGLIDEAEAEAAKAEIGRRILASQDGASAEGDTGKSKRLDAKPMATQILAGIIVTALAVGAFGIYLYLGSPGQPGLPFAERLDLKQVPHSSPEELLAQVQEQVKRQPEDAQSWLTLARLLRERGDFADSIEAYRTASELLPGRAQVLAELAETIVAESDGIVVPEARQIFAKVLELDPASPHGLYYAGLALSQDGRLEDARNIWGQLASASPPDAPWMPILRQQLSRIDEALGKPPKAEDPGLANLPAEQAQMIKEMVAGLASRLEEDGDDLEGWIMLARSYRILGNTDAALSALERAEPLLNDLAAENPLRDQYEKERRALTDSP